MSSKTVPAPDAGDAELLWTRRLGSLDRYLKAAGLSDPTKRLRLARSITQDLGSRAASQEAIDWEEIVASIDRHLSLENGLDLGGDGHLACRGRIAQHHGEGVEDRLTSSIRLAQQAGRAVPPRCPRPMPAQELDLPRLSMQRLWPAQLWRPAQSLVVGFCCLAVVLIP